MLDKTKDADQLFPEPTATERRSMLIAGAKDFLSHEPTAEEAVDEFIAKHGMPAPTGIAMSDDTQDDPYISPNQERDGVTAADLAVPEQYPIFVYGCKAGDITIRQPIQYDDDDVMIRVAPCNLAALIAKLQTFLPEGSR